MSDIPFAAKGAFDGLPRIQGAGVQAEEVRGLGLATVMLRKDAMEGLRERFGARFGLQLPGGPTLEHTNGISLAGTGPGVWLAMRDGGGHAFAGELAAALDGVASVSDQSSGYAVMRLTGPRARAVAQKGAPVDLDPAVFPVNGVAVTTIAHLGVIICQSAPDVFDLMVFRSMAGSFHHWLADAVAT